MNAIINKRIGTVLMAALLSAALIPAAAEACRGGRGGRGGGQGMGMDCGMRGGRGGAAFGIWQNPQAVQDLGISAEQVKKLKEAEFAAREKQLPLNAELDSLRLKMDQAFATEPVDEKAVLELTEKISAVKGKMAVQMTEERLAMKKILTPEQVAKMDMRRGAGMGGGKPCGMNGQGMGQGNGGKPCPMGGQGGNKPCNGNGPGKQ
ncbi:Spy/CpxP family protein refolding chaperone [Candidatus Electronema sp. PJ]|uniref:Spy/CpxP family protein refolding chaperone n=1 Tax=Candidatus Electronema sp. PJ TaxID=3401572 RepID=UPI003AA7FE4B